MRVNTRSMATTVARAASASARPTRRNDPVIGEIWQRRIVWVHVHDAEREVRVAAHANAFLLAVEAVAVRPVVGEVSKVCAIGRFRQGRRTAPRHISRSAATSAVAHPQNGSSTISPGVPLGLT